ncbi:unnamed protein product [Citrullus colocynthis]|uniref:S-protein homolog n=1 Tax=Citrullus colocynthis TaxID=252529 RepID=A0ABP0YTY0_9ROSI
MHQLVLLPLGFLLITFQPTVESAVRQPNRSFIDLKKFHVEIRNMMEMYILDSHCRSKDNDLGLHILLPGERQRWSFRTNIWETTLFHCTLKWERGSREFKAFYFDDAFFSVFCPDRECVWLAEQGGLSMVNRVGEHILRYRWNSL